MNARATLGTIAALAACALAGARAHAAEKPDRTLLLATTTSTQDSGLLDALLPIFEKRTGYVVKTIAVGTGQALALGRRGEADVLLVHAPAEEQRLVDEGTSASRRLVMHNDFVVVGPPADPARIQGAASAKDAFARIAAAGVPFLSRGDGSGTHSKEKALWKAAGVNPEGRRWYQQTGLGMGETLNVASEKGGYTLSDRATLLARGKARPLGLEILFEGDPGLLNVYHVIEVSPARWPKVNAAGARAFADFLVSRQGQELIGKFGVDRFGAPLFFPDAGRRESALGL